MKIRKATNKDLDILTDFCYEEEKLHSKFDKNADLKKDAKKRIYNFLKKNITKNNYTAFIAQDGDKPIGILTGEIKNSYFTYKISKIGHLGTAFVKKEYRQKGVAKELFKAMTKWFKSKHIKFFDLYVHSQNKVALQAWKKLGFKEVLKLMKKEI